MNNTYSDEMTESIRRALVADNRFEFRREGDFLRQGICPNCGKKTCYIKLSDPYRVSCDRLNKCGWSASTRDLYRDLFESLSRRIRPTKENPNATADAYMRDIRGFNLDKIRGMYRQGAVYIEATGQYFPAVEVSIGPDVVWKRIIDAEGVKANDGKKAKIHGSYKDTGWIPPGMTFDKGDTIWITEGIFKSMAFLHIGKKAISGLSAINLPRNIIKANAGKRIRWIIALDADRAGEVNSRKFHAELEELKEIVFVAFPAPDDGDWDDLYRAGKLDEHYLQQSIRRGFQTLANTPGEYAFFLWSDRKQNYLVFDFRGALYHCEVSASRDKLPNYPQNGRYDLEKKYLLAGLSSFRDCSELVKICECNPRAVYTQHERETGRRSAVFHITFSDSRRAPRLMELEGNALRTADTFNNELLKTSVYYAFTGDNTDLKLLRARWAESGQREVTVIPYSGYEHETEIYAFSEFAYRHGEYQEVNDYGYFDFNGTCLKTTHKTLDLVERERIGQLPENFFSDFIKVFGPNGLVLLGWWTGTLFAEQLRKKQASWCFMEFTGERGAGKSTLLRLLWKMTGVVKDQEGLDPNKNSDVGFFRLMAQYSNLPIVLLEADGVMSDSGKSKGFNFNRLKEFYNFGAPTRTVAAFTNGLELRQDIFRGGLLVSQNNEIVGTEDGALLSRFVSCRCTKEHFTPETRLLAEKFEQFTAAELGGYLHAVLSREPEFWEAYQANYKAARNEFARRNSQGTVKDDRVLKCHAQVAGWIRTLSLLFGATPEFGDAVGRALDLLWERAEAKQRRLSGEHPMLETFWSNFDYINHARKKENGGDPEILNHSSNPGMIAIQFADYTANCKRFFLEVPPEQELRVLFPNSRTYKYLEKKPVKSRLENRSIRCYVFLREHSDS